MLGWWWGSVNRGDGVDGGESVNIGDGVMGRGNGNVEDRGSHRG